jgi:hypothetical protein
MKLKKSAPAHTFGRRESLGWGLSGDEHFVEMARDDGDGSILIVRRPQLTWRMLGHAETLGLRVKHLRAVIDLLDDTTAEIFVVWRYDSEVGASIEAWREAERCLQLPRRAQHYVIMNEARRQTLQPAA